MGFAEPLRGSAVTVNIFEVMGIKPVIGREFSEADARPGAAPVALLSERAWKARYGSDPAIVGRSVRVNATPTTIVGVMATAPLIQEGNTGLWLPFGAEDRTNDRGRRRLSVYGRLAPGFAAGAADAEVAAHGAALAREYPENESRMSVFVARDFRAFSLPERVQLLFLVMLGAVGFVLLVACANVANLLLARAAGRAREIAIRSAIGASRWRVIRQLLVESLLLSSVGGVLGLALAIWGVRVVRCGARRQRTAAVAQLLGRLHRYCVSRGDHHRHRGDFRARSRLAAFEAGHHRDAEGRLRRLEGAAGSAFVMSTLVIAEMTLAVVLLAGAGVMIRSFLNVYSDAGRLRQTEPADDAAEYREVLRRG